MAITSVASSGTRTNKITGSTWQPAHFTVVAGLELIVQLAVDNLNGADGDNSEHQTVEDSVGNVYSKLREFTNGQGAAAAGVTVSLWHSKITEAIDTTVDLWDILFAGAVTAKVLGAWRFAVAAGNTLALEASDVRADNGADAGALTLSGLPNIEHLFWRIIGFEAASSTALTQSAGWTVGNSNQTAGSTGLTNIGLRNEWRILTGTTATSDPTSGGGAVDHASILVALKEVAIPRNGSAVIEVSSDVVVAGTKGAAAAASVDVASSIDTVASKGAAGAAVIDPSVAIELTGKKGMAAALQIDVASSVDAGGSKGGLGAATLDASCDLVAAGFKAASRALSVLTSCAVDASGSKQAFAEVDIEVLVALLIDGTPIPFRNLECFPEAPEAKWAVGEPLLKWSAGEPEAKWKAEEVTL